MSSPDSRPPHTSLSIFPPPQRPSSREPSVPESLKCRIPTTCRIFFAAFRRQLKRSPATYPAKSPYPQRRANSSNPPAPYSASVHRAASQAQPNPESRRPGYPRQTESPRPILFPALLSSAPKNPQQFFQTVLRP